MSRFFSLVGRNADLPLVLFKPFARSRLRITFSRGFITQSVLVCGSNERHKQRMRVERLRFELRVELTTKKPRVVGKLNYLDELSVRRLARENKPVSSKLVL